MPIREDPLSDAEYRRWISVSPGSWGNECQYDLQLQYDWSAHTKNALDCGFRANGYDPKYRTTSTSVVFCVVF